MSEANIPDPPLRCLCRRDTGMAAFLQWFFVWGKLSGVADWRGDNVPVDQLTVIPHPLNDLEAVAMIEAARKEVK